MRFYRKKELISYLKEMKCKQQKLLLLQKNYQEILFDLQECAIIIGEEIEREDTIDSKIIVKILEDYCEIIYQISLLNAQAITQKYVDNLDDKLSQVIFKVHEMHTDKIKIAFFPYKASMWDCMDSVWKCAVKDDQCEVEVIPIPFFELNNGKNEAVECYEGEKAVVKPSPRCSSFALASAPGDRRTAAPTLSKSQTKSRYGRFRISSFLISGFIAIPPCPCS